MTPSARVLVLIAAAALALPVACSRSRQPEQSQQPAQEQQPAQQQPQPQPQPSQPPPVPTAEQATPQAAPAPPAPAKRASTRRTEPTRETGPSGTGAQPREQSPAPPPPLQEVVRTVQSGTVIPVRFEDGLSSKGSQKGETFRATVTNDVSQDGMVLIPAGSTVLGTVIDAVPLKKIGGQAHLAVEFSRIELPGGRSAPIHASFAETGKSETGKDAATIGGAAAGGAILGRILSKDQANRNTVIGAIVGAAAGTAIAAKTKGQEVAIPAGTVLNIKLDQPTQVTVTERR